jgi:predicted Zn-dependent protease with MMP-like domain/Flp pilus assembly protein TadD
MMARLDQGWEQLKDNDFRGAEHSAQVALERMPDSPEALTLLGAVAAAEGDEEEALEQYRRAMDADPEYVLPMLFSAELLLAPDGDPDEALKLIDAALDLAEEEDEVLDAMLLRVEALVARGDADGEALASLDQLPPVDMPDAIYHLRAGRAYCDLDRPAPAIHHLERALALGPEGAWQADAWHGLGSAHEIAGEPEAQARAWNKVRELDLAEAAPPWGISKEAFDGAASEALEQLPPRVRKLLENVPILASDYPDPELIADGHDPRMLGFFSGVPYPEKSNASGSAGHLDTVHLFQRNIERLCRTREEVYDEVVITILHETGHFFGLSEEDLEKMGLD